VENDLTRETLASLINMLFIMYAASPSNISS
jgi:hypothetical protein